MNKIFKFFALSKRQKFVVSILILSLGLLFSQFTAGIYIAVSAVVLSLLTILLLYFSFKDDLKDVFSYPIFILPFFFTASFVLFYPLVPARLITHIISISTYALGLYSLFLTQNIFAVSAIRTINLMRSARIVSFVLTIVVLFFLTNVVFSIRLPIYLSPFIIFSFIFLLNFQLLWTYSLSREFVSEVVFLSAMVSLAIAELSLILNLWPINASIYSIFITGIFYAYSGLTHTWLEKRLFKGVLWEYIWVGFISVLILIFFSKWGF